MDETPQAPVAPEANTVFNGRDFVAPDEPIGESSSPTDGNDDDGSQAAEDVPSSDTKAAPKADTDESGDDADADAGEAATFWNQTPEEKREKRFNDTLTHSQAQAKREKEHLAKLASYEAKIAEYEAGTGPKPTKAETEAAIVESQTPTPESIVVAAIDPQADVTKLSENQRTIRGLSMEVAALRKELVAPAQQTFAEAEKALSDAETALKEEQTYLSGLKRRAQGRDGLYDSEIAEAEGSIQRLEMALTRAETRHVKALMGLDKAKERVAIRQEANLNKANALAKQDGRRHQETASQKQYDEDYKAEETKLAKAWAADLNKVIDKLKIPKEDREDAEALAFARVKAIGDKRGDKNPVTEAEFETLITQALQRMATRSGSVAGRTEAEVAEARAAATDQPAPKQRKASPSDAQPPSVEEARKELLQTFQSGRVRIRAA